MVLKLDVTDPADAEAAVKAAVDRFGKIDVLVNNAGNFYAGFFEEISPENFRAQIETNLLGPVNVARAVLPVMKTAVRPCRNDLFDGRHRWAGIRARRTPRQNLASRAGSESLAPEVGEPSAFARCW